MYINTMLGITTFLFAKMLCSVCSVYMHMCVVCTCMRVVCVMSVHLGNKCKTENLRSTCGTTYNLKKKHMQQNTHSFLHTLYSLLLVTCCPQEEVMFRYFVFDSSMIIGLLEEPFISGGTLCFFL